MTRVSMLRVRVFLRPVLYSRGYRSSAQKGLAEFDDEYAGGEVPKHREVIKNVYQESETTAGRSKEDIENFKNEHSITIVGEAPNPVLTIDELKLPEKLNRIFGTRNISTPTPIQSLCWPLAMSGRDMIGVAQTGSGKTLGYLVPAAMHIEQQPKIERDGPAAVVLAPTRELVQQISTVSGDWLFPSMRIKHCGVYGGASRLYQLNDLRRGVQLCIATPGRMLDFINNGELMLNNTSFLVLDEADRMLDMGFEPQIREIIGSMRSDRQTLMFSATWPQDVRSLAKDFMLPDTTRINIGSTELCASENITQELRFFDSDAEKSAELFDLLEQHRTEKVLVFAATKRKVSQLALNIIRNGMRCVESHGDLSQARRDKALQLFKGSCNVMVATDVAARGIDVQNIKLVINFDFPQTIEDYVHRIGRTGRYNASGRSVTFFSQEKDKPFAKELVQVLTRAKQEVPSLLREIVDEREQAPAFRRKYVKTPFNYRLDKASNWRRYAKKY